MYDLDGDEGISKADFLAVYLQAHPNVSREEARQVVEELFSEVCVSVFVCSGPFRFRV